MNARQVKKHLKREIRHLKSDNDLMHRIIADSSTMQELYDLYNKQVHVVYEHPRQHYKIKSAIDERELVYAQNSSMLKTHIENNMLRELRPCIWDNLITEKDIYNDKVIYSLDIWM